MLSVVPSFESCAMRAVRLLLSLLLCMHSSVRSFLMVRYPWLGRSDYYYDSSIHSSIHSLIHSFTYYFQFLPHCTRSLARLPASLRSDSHRRGYVLRVLTDRSHLGNVSTFAPFFLFFFILVLSKINNRCDGDPCRFRMDDKEHRGLEMGSHLFVCLCVGERERGLGRIYKKERGDVGSFHHPQHHIHSFIHSLGDARGHTDSHSSSPVSQAAITTFSKSAAPSCLRL